MSTDALGGDGVDQPLLLHGTAASPGLCVGRAFVIDPRARFATSERFPAAERVIVAWPQEAFAQLDPIDRATAIERFVSASA